MSPDGQAADHRPVLVSPASWLVLRSLWWGWRQNWSIGKPERPGGLHYWLGAGDPFDLERATMRASFAEQRLPPYSRLLAEILHGDPVLSIRGDEAEESWRIVEPILAAWEDDRVPIEEYPAGSGGP